MYSETDHSPLLETVHRSSSKINNKNYTSDYLMENH